jgi:hypothetical protein
MLSYVYNPEAAIANFVAELVPHCHRGFGSNIRTIGVVDHGQLIAGLVYHNYDPEAGIIEISGAALPGRLWLTRRTLAVMYEFPFELCDCQMVVQRTPADAITLLGILAAYGYTLVTIKRLFGRERDGVVCTLTREDWLANKFNRKRTAPVMLQKEAA